MNAQTIKRRKNRQGAVQDPDRVGVMTPAEFESMTSEALGGRGWQRCFARGTGLSPSTVTRYLQGVFPIPQYVAVIVHMLGTLRRNGLPVPDSFNIDLIPSEDDDD